MNVLHAGIVYDVADDGTVGGSVVVDPVNFLEQAAIFRGSHQVEVIPRLPGELTSHVRRLATSGLALVESVDATTFVSTYYLRERGRIERLDLGQNQVLFLDMNDAGIVAGTSAPLGGSNMRAFRLAPSQGAITLLAPLPTDPDSWGLAINQCGDVLGYSFIPGAIERIGIWRRGVFDTLFVEGTPETPTISNRLLWNKAGLVVITDTNDLGSYLVPAPGVRRDLRELADVVPPWTLITGVNDDGDLIGEGGTARFSIDETFLLRRTR
jgi:hypothetical protein